MSSHKYEIVPTAEDNLPYYPPNNSYLSGLPSTAPPSFHSTTSIPLPHKNDETAATIMPGNSRPEPIQECSVPDVEDLRSVWAPSEVTTEDFNAVREDVIVRLMDRVEALEVRLEAQIPKEQIEIKSAERKKKWQYLGTGIAVTAFMIWFFGIILLSVMTAYRRAGVNKD